MPQGISSNGLRAWSNYHPGIRQRRPSRAAGVDDDAVGPGSQAGVGSGQARLRGRGEVREASGEAAVGGG